MKCWSKIRIISSEINFECYVHIHFSRIVQFSHLTGLGQVVTKQKNQPKNKKVLSESYSFKIFSIRKQLMYMLDIELDFTESEIE